MQKQRTSYDEDTQKFVIRVDPELVILANEQKPVMGENVDTGKLLFEITSLEEARIFF